MSLFEQLTRERQACLEPLPAAFRSGATETPRSHHAFATEAGDLERLFGGTTECIQLTAGRFAGEATAVTIGAITLHEIFVSCGVLLRTEVGPNRLLIGLASSSNGTGMIENGRPCNSGGLIAVRGRDMVLSVLGATTMTWLDIDLDALTRNQKDDIDRRLKSANFSIEPKHAQVTVLRDYVRAILHCLQRGRFSFSLDGDSARFEVDAVALVLLVLRYSHVTAETYRDKVRAQLVRSVEEFMWENIEGPLTLQQICGAGGCRVRTLIYAFKSYFGLSPMKYFKIRRLNAVRRKLRTAERDVRIFDIAADCGFWHMGHFGTDYKAMFGVTPERTIEQRRLAARSRHPAT